MPAVYPRAETDPIANPAVTAEAIARAAADALKQDAATAGTDAEIASAVAAEAVARGADVDLEEAARIAALALKQDASTAATDAEVTAAIAAAAAPEAWTAATLTNSWANFGSGYESLRFYKHNGVVRIQGAISRGGSSALSPFTLPAGYRPSGHLQMPGYLQAINITDAGVVTPVASTTFLGFAHSFRAA